MSGYYINRNTPCGWEYLDQCGEWTYEYDRAALLTSETAHELALLVGGWVAYRSGR